MFKPTQQHLDIIQTVQEGKNVVINATAGSGKTSTLKYLCEEIIPTNVDVLSLAFNKHNVKDLKAKLPKNVEVRTIHGLGYYILREHFGIPARQFKVDNFKYNKKIKDLATAIDKDRVQSVVKEIKQTWDLYRNTLSTDFQVEILSLELINECIKKLVDFSIKSFKSDKLIDATDMIWLPMHLNCADGFSLIDHPVIMIDETQDLNKCEIDLLKRIVELNSNQVIAVGDTAQAIMVFAGADNYALDTIAKAFKSVTLPLSVTYRCPVSHCKLAKEYGNIESAPNAIQGTVKEINENALFDHLVADSIILSRTNAPLINLCLQLICKGYNAKIKGVDFSKKIIGVIEDCQKFKKFTWKNFVAFLDRYYEIRLERLQKKEGTEKQQENLADLVECVRQLYLQSPEITSVSRFIAKIESIFSDTKAAIWLSSVHRSKGLEANDVFIYNPKKMPLKWKNQTPEEYKQELNILFVALTRSKQNLTMVNVTE